MEDLADWRVTADFILIVGSPDKLAINSSAVTQQKITVDESSRAAAWHISYVSYPLLD